MDDAPCEERLAEAVALLRKARPCVTAEAERQVSGQQRRTDVVPDDLWLPITLGRIDALLAKEDR